MKNRIFNTFLIVMLLVQFGYGQERKITSIDVNFIDIPDTIIKNELAFFCKKSKSLGYSQLDSSLKEINPHVCNDSLVGFNFGDTYINIKILDIGKGQIESSGLPAWGVGSKSPKRKMGALSVVTHSHFGVCIPSSALAGLYEPFICKGDFAKVSQRKLFNSGKKKLSISDFYKVFVSLDKRRTYVYMQGGAKGKEYEVTWIFEASKYLYRVIDRLR